MDVNCAVHVLQISRTQKWKNRHLKQCIYVLYVHQAFIINMFHMSIRPLSYICSVCPLGLYHIYSMFRMPIRPLSYTYMFRMSIRPLSYMCSVFPLGVLYLEHSQLALQTVNLNEDPSKKNQIKNCLFSKKYFQM